MKSLREQIENFQNEICVLRNEMEEKNTLKKMIHSKLFPPKTTFSSPIYRQYQSNNASKKTPFHEQNMPESPQEQSSDPSNRGTSKDHHTNSILIPSIKKSY